MDIVNKNLIVSTSVKLTRDEAIEKISKILKSEKFVDESEDLISKFIERENKVSTGLGEGIAIPHATSKSISSPKIVIMRSKSLIDWNSLDGNGVNLIIAIVVPENGRSDHLTILSKISGMLVDSKTTSIMKNGSKDQILELIESELNPKEVKKPVTTMIKQSVKIVCVTSCPTGIAHTFMAAKALEDTAAKNGWNVRVEKQGAETVDPLTSEEIAEAKTVILAVDREIDKTRFAGKNVIEVRTTAAIKDPENLIKSAMEGSSNNKYSASKMESTGKKVSLGKGEGTLTFDNFKQRVIKSIMTGASTMLPFVIFGGILIALSFLIDIPNADDPAFGNVNTVASWFNQIGGLAMGFIVPVLGGFIGNALIGKQGMLPGFIVGFIALGQGPDWVEMMMNGNPPNWVPPEAAAQGGASGFIGAIAGGLLTGIVFIQMDKWIFSKISSKLQGIKLVLIMPLFGTLVVAGIFWLVNIPLTFVMWGLYAFLELMSPPHLAWILGGVLGAMMATDMGGPLNKTAYIFGTTTLASAGALGSVPMAAVMLAGMTPPLGIAIATLFKRDKIWDQDDISGGYTNWVMGLSFITEGAIPFATKYPKAIMPSIIAGSAIAGITAGALNVGALAPHGGIFVIALFRAQVFDAEGMQIGMGVLYMLLPLIIGSGITAGSIVFLRNREVNKLNQIAVVKQQEAAKRI